MRRMLISAVNVPSGIALGVTLMPAKPVSPLRAAKTERYAPGGASSFVGDVADEHAMSSVQTMSGAAKSIDSSRGRAVAHPGLLVIAVPLSQEAETSPEKRQRAQTPRMGYSCQPDESHRAPSQMGAGRREGPRATDSAGSSGTPPNRAPVHGLVRGLNWTDEMDVSRVRPSGGSLERLTHHHTAVTFLAPLDARTLLYVARGEDGSGPWLWALDTESKVTRRATSGLDKYTSVAASRDGQRIVATIGNPTVSLWRVPILDRQADEADVQRYPVTTERALAPRFGGTSLFFLSARGTGDGLWRFQDGQAFEVRKGTDGPLLEPPAVSRDGKRVAVVLGKGGTRHLAIMTSVAS